MKEKLSSWIVESRYLLLLIVMGAFAFSTFGFKKLTINTDYKHYLDQSSRDSIQSLEDIYGKNINILMALRPNLEKSSDIYNAEFLAGVESLTEKAWQTPHSTRVDSLTNFQRVKVDDDFLKVENLVKNAKEMKEEELQEIASFVKAEPRLRRMLVSEDGQLTAININLNIENENFDKTAEAVEFVFQLKEDFLEKFPGSKIYMSGAGLLSYELTQAAIRDLKVYVPLMYLVLFFLLGWLLRSAWAVFLTLNCLGISLAMTMGLCGWLGIPISNTMAMAPTLLLTLGVADCVHIFVGFLSRYREGVSKAKALLETLKVNISPVFMTSFTTAVGFLSLNSSDSTNFRELGNVVALGVSLLFFVAIFLLPALILILPIKPQMGQTKIFGRSFIQQLAQLVLNKPRTLALSVIALSVFCVFGVQKNVVDENFLEFLDHSNPVRSDTELISKELIGLYTIQYDIPSGQIDGISDPDYLQGLDQLASWFRQQPEVIQVSSVSDIFKDLNRSLNGGVETQYRLPEDSSLSAQYFLLYEMSLPFGLDLNSKVNLEKSNTHFVVHPKNLSNRELIQFGQKAKIKIDELLVVENRPSNVVSGATAFAKITQNNVVNMLQGTGMALLVVSLVLMLAFRSFSMGLLSLVPNILPALIGFGLWGVLMGKVGLAVSSVIGMTFGIVVDDTIHFLSHYLDARRRDKLSPRASIEKTFSTVGIAVIITTVVLMAGFSILGLSSFTMNSHMSQLTALIVFIALVVDLFFLPQLLLAYEKLLRRET